MGPLVAGMGFRVGVLGAAGGRGACRGVKKTRVGRYRDRSGSRVTQQEPQKALLGDTMFAFLCCWQCASPHDKAPEASSVILSWTHIYKGFKVKCV